MQHGHRSPPTSACRPAKLTYDRCEARLDPGRPTDALSFSSAQTNAPVPAFMLFVYMRFKKHGRCLYRPHLGHCSCCPAIHSPYVFHALYCGTTETGYTDILREEHSGRIHKSTSKPLQRSARLLQLLCYRIFDMCIYMHCYHCQQIACSACLILSNVHPLLIFIHHE